MSQGCSICGAPALAPAFAAREMMLGTREEFHYARCLECGTISLIDEPDDFGPYYRADSYYSFNEHSEEPPRPVGTLQGAGVEMLLRLRLPESIYQYDRRLAVARWFRGLGVRRNSHILDVGTGSGWLLHLMASVGFTDLDGVDPFAAASQVYPDGVRLTKGEVGDIQGPFKVVMFHHSLEHVADPGESLSAARRLVAEDGWCLVRVPVADSWAYRTYGADWVQLDAPRHRFLFTHEAVSLLAMRAGFVVQSKFCDSNPFQLWGSEQYQRDIPLHPVDDDDARQRDRSGRRVDLFPDEVMRSLKQRSAALNAAGEGDQACFVLQPVAPEI
jgi:SAM-dependent methyltransferase